MLKFYILALTIPSAWAVTVDYIPQEGDFAFEMFNAQVEAVRAISIANPSENGQVLHFLTDARKDSWPSVFPLGEWDRQTWGSSNARNGLLTFTIGHLEADPTRYEMRKFYGAIKWALAAGFHVAMDPAATKEDLREFVSKSDSSVVIWSSHGSADGTIWDARQDAVPTDSFSEDASELLKFYVLSNCHSEVTAKKYSFASGSQYMHWRGLTNSDELFSYIYSPAFDYHLRQQGFNF